MLPKPNGDVSLSDYMHKPKSWGVFLRTKAPNFDAIRLHCAWVSEEIDLRQRKPDFVLIPQRTATEMFPEDAGCAEDALKRWSKNQDLDYTELPQADALKAMARHDALNGKVVFTTAISGEQFATYGFIMTWADFQMVREIQRTTVT
jgi:hypothetical protein